MISSCYNWKTVWRRPTNSLMRFGSILIGGRRFLCERLFETKERTRYFGPWWWSSGQRAWLLLRQWVRIPLASTVFSVNFVFEKNENKQKVAGVCPFKKTTLNLIYFELDNCRQLSSDLPKRVSHLLLLLLGDAFEMHKSALIKVALIDSRMKEATAPATPTSSTTTPSLKENFLTITSGGELIDISKNLNLWSIELFPPPPKN